MSLRTCMPVVFCVFVGVFANVLYSISLKWSPNASSLCVSLDWNWDKFQPPVCKKAQGLMFLIVGTKLNQEVTYIEVESYFWQIFGIFMGSLSEHLLWVGEECIHIRTSIHINQKLIFMLVSFSSPWVTSKKSSFMSFASWVYSTSKAYNVD